MSFLCLALGAVGLGLNVLWPLVKGRTPMLVWQGVGCWLFAGHFFLLPQPAVTGGWINVISGAQCFLAIPFDRYPRFRWMYLATLPLLVWLVWQGFLRAGTMQASWAAVASGCAMLLMCLGRFQIDVMKLRWLILAALPCWLVHNILMQAWPAIVSDFATITSCIIGLRLALEARKRGQKPPLEPPPATA